jgi:hypothetical protein
LTLEKNLLVDVDNFYIHEVKKKYFFSHDIPELQSLIKQILNQLDGLSALTSKIQGYLWEASSEYRQKKHEVKCQSCLNKRLTDQNASAPNYQHLLTHTMKNAQESPDHDTPLDLQLASYLSTSLAPPDKITKEFTRRKSH